MSLAWVPDEHGWARAWGPTPKASSSFLKNLLQNPAKGWASAEAIASEVGTCRETQP